MATQQAHTPNAISNGHLHCGRFHGKCHTMSTGQCPAQACKTEHMIKEIMLKGQPISNDHSASVQEPLYTLHMQMPMVNVECRNTDTKTCCSFSHRTLFSMNPMGSSHAYDMAGYMPMPSHRIMGDL
jgi:hypothetical protein